MKPEIKERWLTALRSGQYQQGTKALQRQGDRYCCLGVLCDLARQDGIVTCRTPDEDGFVRFVDAGPVSLADSSSTTLTEGVVKWAGLDKPNPTIPRPVIESFHPLFEAKDESVGNSLAELNDVGVPFAKIADLIEQHL